MIVLPDGKVCRNLPEQVAENLKKIQEIIHFLDGVNIQDNLVVIADLSQILTAAEIEIVERPVAFIYYNAELYIKKNEAAGVAYFINVFSIEDTGTQLNFNSNEMQVDLGTGALTYTTATASSYTKSQIDSLLALKANDAEVAKLTGAAFTGAITGPSIIEDMNGYSFQAATKANASLTYTYAGICKNGNKITFTCSGYLRVLGTIAGWNVPLCYFNMPASIGQNLIPTLVGDVNGLAFVQLYFAKGYATGVSKPCVVFKNGNQQIAPSVYVLNDLDQNVDYLFRFEITFLLSDNLAA